jgi:hypothetical protein
MHLAKRQAKIGNQIPSRGETHGDETVTALDIPLTDIMLDELELGEIMREPRAADALFNKGNGAAVPFFRHIKPIALDEKIEGASITITHSIGNESIRLVNVKLAKIKLEPCTGGMTAMDCTVQCTPDLNEDVAHLLGKLNAIVDVEIDGGEFGKQAELEIEPTAAPAADEIGGARRKRRARVEEEATA